jgi:hypothetical protein
MSWDRRQSAPYTVRTVLKQFDDREIELPETVTAAVAELQRIQAEHPAEPEHAALHDAVLAGADRAELDRLLLIELGAQRLRVAYTQATLTAADRVLGAIMRARDEIHPQLRALADDAIAKLTAVAKLGDATLDALVREGRHDDAQAVAAVDITAAELNELYNLRDQHIVPGGAQALSVGHVNASRWRDPIAAAHYSGGATLAEQFLTGLKGGVELWFPTPEEAVEVAQPIYARLQAEAEEVAAHQRSVGGLKAFG